MPRLAWRGWVPGLLLALAGPLSAQEPERPRAELGENFPNPFYPSTTIPFTLLPEACEGGRRPVVTLKIYNVLAQEVATPVLRGTDGLRIDGVRLLCGAYLADWGGWSDNMETQVTTGVYLFRLTVDGQRFAGKMLARRPPPGTP